MSNPADYYEVLGVARDADAATLKKAFRQLAIQYHPDRNSAPDAEDRFKAINEAYAVLSDPEKRARYDRFGHEGLSGRAGPREADLRDVFGGDLFEQLFGGFARRATRPGARHGDDVRLPFPVTLEEVAAGGEKSVTFRRQATCATCDGSGAQAGHAPVTCDACGGMGRVRVQHGFLPMVTGCPRCRGEGRIVTHPCGTCRGNGLVQEEVTLKVPVPAGSGEGHTLRLDGEGGQGVRGGQPGDLYLIIQEAEHPFFERDGDHLVCEVPISFPQAALGSNISVPTLDGKARVKVPSGTQSGRVLRLRGKGLPNVEGRGRGDQLVRLQIETPVDLSPRQRELLEELESLSGDHPGQPRRKSFLDKLKELFD